MRSIATCVSLLTAVTCVFAGAIGCPKCSCGLIGPVLSGRRSRIVGGEEAMTGEVPWLARLVREDQVVCGATLISATHVITAAHCLISSNASDVTVLIGQHKETEESLKLARKVSQIIIHPQFNRYSYDNDIALIRLAEPLPTGTDASVCLPKKMDKDAMAGQTGLVVGWGKTYEDGPFPDVAMKAYVNIWSADECENAGYSSSKITPRMICAASSDTDSCNGDSGGPLLLGYPHTLVGIISWGRGCARTGYPGVYTRVDQYIPWLRSQMKDHCFCFTPRTF